ncbi:MAG: calcium-binding protein [Elainellaceae cyanobacterium]
MEEIFVGGIFNPVGILADDNGTVFVNSDNGLDIILSSFTPDGALINQASISGGFFDIVGQVNLVQDPVSGALLGLRSDGILLAIDPVTLAAAPVLDIRTLDINISEIFDVATGQVGAFGGLIQPAFATFGDIDVRQNGTVTEFFITGFSQAQAFPFVLRIQTEGGAVLDAQVILSSSAEAQDLLGTPQSVRLERGIAVNDQGTVLTTLPTATTPEGETLISSFDAPVAFSADFDPADGAGPGAPSFVLNGIDIASQGLTTDAAGNFYITTTSVGSAALGVPGEGALIAVSADLNQILGVEALGTVASTFRDVAINPVTQEALVTVDLFSVGPVANDAVVAFPLAGLEPTAVPGNPFIGVPGTPLPEFNFSPSTDDDDLFPGSFLNDAFSGAAGDDSAFGGLGSDFFRGGSGNDSLSGGPGDDTLIGNAGDDVISGNDGSDTIRGRTGNDIISGGQGMDIIRGDSGNDIIIGNLGNDRLFGNGGNDEIRGDRGADVLFGLAGSDILTGGGGRDTFVVSNQGGSDTITDFSSEDDRVRLAGGLTLERISIIDTAAGAQIEVDGRAIALFTGASASAVSESVFV